ncbi:AraC family transcriptional regulator [Sphingobacterium sp.]|jgi:AraC-like DNA-binding protein|uniref:AraC family transcriptional regulator n=1 Tax=Sphingobacterium sp. TaxID=341027 RepID=UPI002897FA1C|nr:AraC family transcriptional regulator [Sphingobacterium sp.]
MKPVQFKVPAPQDRSIYIQEDVLDKFYPYMHRHEEYQLIWIKEGIGQLFVDDNVHDFQPGDIFLLGANQAHVFKSFIAGGFVRSVSCFFSTNGALSPMSMMPELRNLLDFLNKCQRGFKVPTKHLAQVSYLIEILQKSDFLDQLVNFFYLLKSLSKVFAELEPLSGVQSPKNELTKPFRIEKLCKFLEEHFKEDISLDEIAEKANLTPHAFCRYFKNCTGKTFVAYLNELRIREACKLLGLGRHDSISLIAYDAGFNSITNFNRVFRNILGISPKIYVRNYRNYLYD